MRYDRIKAFIDRKRTGSKIKTMGFLKRTFRQNARTQLHVLSECLLYKLIVLLCLPLARCPPAICL